MGKQPLWPPALLEATTSSANWKHKEIVVKHSPGQSVPLAGSGRLTMHRPAHAVRAKRTAAPRGHQPSALHNTVLSSVALLKTLRENGGS